MSLPVSEFMSVAAAARRTEMLANWSLCFITVVGLHIEVDATSVLGPVPNCSGLTDTSTPPPSPSAAEHWEEVWKCLSPPPRVYPVLPSWDLRTFSCELPRTKQTARHSGPRGVTPNVSRCSITAFSIPGVLHDCSFKKSNWILYITQGARGHRSQRRGRLRKQDAELMEEEKTGDVNLLLHTYCTTPTAAGRQTQLSNTCDQYHLQILTNFRFSYRQQKGLNPNPVKTSNKNCEHEQNERSIMS